MLAGLGNLNLVALRISLLQALEVVDWIQFPEIIRQISTLLLGLLLVPGSLWRLLSVALMLVHLSCGEFPLVQILLMFSGFLTSFSAIDQRKFCF